MTVIARRDSYHGMTMGGTTATGVSALRDASPAAARRRPHRAAGLVRRRRHRRRPRAHDRRARPENVAAFLGEPVAMPPGLAIPPDDYWPAIREVCTRHDVRLDRGRGDHGLRAYRAHVRQRALVDPPRRHDHGQGHHQRLHAPRGRRHQRGALPRLVESDTILPHGFTAGGHPVACAVALANIAIIEREDLAANAAAVGRHLATRLAELTDLPRRDPALTRRRHAQRVRPGRRARHGSADTASTAGARLTEALIDAGILVRHYGNTTVVCPVLTATPCEIDHICARIDETLGRAGARRVTRRAARARSGQRVRLEERDDLGGRPARGTRARPGG